MSADNRKKVLQDWISGKIKIVIATIAFGMGIDKPDVRFVIHHTLSKSIEDFYQESGRAGRDGKASISLVYYGEEDKSLIEFLIGKDSDPLKSVEENEQNLKVHREAFSGMVEFCRKASCRRRHLLSYFGENSVTCNKTCDYCLNPEAVKAMVLKLEKPVLSSVSLSCFTRAKKKNTNTEGEEEGISSYTMPKRKLNRFKSFEPEVDVSAINMDGDAEDFFAAFKAAEAGNNYKSKQIQTNFTSAKEVAEKLKTKKKEETEKKIQHAKEVLKRQQGALNSVKSTSALKEVSLSTPFVIPRSKSETGRSKPIIISDEPEFSSRTTKSTVGNHKDISSFFHRK